MRWLLMQEQLKGASETGRVKSPWVPAHKWHCSISSADRTGYTAIHLSEMLFCPENTEGNINF